MEEHPMETANRGVPDEIKRATYQWTIPMSQRGNSGRAINRSTLRVPSRRTDRQVSPHTICRHCQLPPAQAAPEAGVADHTVLLRHKLQWLDTPGTDGFHEVWRRT